MSLIYTTFRRRFDTAKLIELRKKAGYTQLEMCVKIYFEQRVYKHYAKLEDGTAKPSLENLMRICKMLNCKLDELAPRIEQP